MRDIWVDCKRAGKVIQTYYLPQPSTLKGDVPPPARLMLINEAKMNLINERLAFWPCDDIEFDVRYR
jgi:hypothetical protein